MRVMSIVCFVFDVCCGDGDASFALLGRFIDRTILEKFCQTFFGLPFGDGGGQGGLYPSAFDILLRKRG